MTLQEFNKSIVKAHEFIKRLNLSRGLINPSSLSVNKEFNSIIMGYEPSHESIYFKGLELNYFNFLLVDYSYFQFSFYEKEAKPEVRLAFYPNPMAMDNDVNPESSENSINFYEALFRSGDISFEDFSQALNEIKPNIFAPIIRYDVSFNQYKGVNHPVCHFHLGVNNSSRLGSDKILSPEVFVMFILRTYYFTEWNEINTDDNVLDRNLGALKSQLTKLQNNHFCEIQDGILNII